MNNPHPGDGVEYQDEFDRKRQDSLLPFSVQPSNLSKEDVFKNVNYNVYYQMGCDKVGTDFNGIIAEELSVYKATLQNLNSIKNLQFLTAKDLSNLTPHGNQVLCNIRHDVDADIVGALHQAKIENELGIRSTYYLLHTAIYFGQWQFDDNKAVFHRNEAMASVYLELQGLGHEVAIHSDPMHLYQNLKVDGAKAFLEDLNWLRSIGLEISGTAPHNNPIIYGASNSSIFSGFETIEIDGNKNAKGVVKDGKWAPLGVLDMAALGLIYEADDVYRRVGCVDFISIVNRNKWWRYLRKEDRIETISDIFRTYSVGDYESLGLSEDKFWITNEGLIEAVGSTGEKIVILSVHPEYYGWRLTPHDEPILKE